MEWFHLSVLAGAALIYIVIVFLFFNTQNTAVVADRNKPWPPKRADCPVGWTRMVDANKKVYCTFAFEKKTKASGTGTTFLVTAANRGALGDLVKTVDADNESFAVDRKDMPTFYQFSNTSTTDPSTITVFPPITGTGTTVATAITSTITASNINNATGVLIVGFAADDPNVNRDTKDNTVWWMQKRLVWE